MTLVCHHPEVASNRERYYGTDPEWRENDGVIDVADGTIYTEKTIANHTRTILNITITVDHFRNKSFNYSCELQLAENRRLITSGNVTVDPVGE